MTPIWSAFVEVFQSGLFVLTQFYGGQLGAAIVSLSLMARLALLPLTVRLALRARAHSRRLKALQPALRRVRERWNDDPRRQGQETLAVYRNAHVSPVDGGLLGGALLQAPVFLGLYHAVRGVLGARVGRQAYLWVTDLARPDVLVATLAATLVGLGALAGASESQPAWTLALAAVSTGVMAMVLSAGFGLYLAANGSVSILQGLIVRRIEATRV